MQGAVFALLCFVGKQTRDAAERGRAHHSEHDPGPDGAAAAQQPAHKIELEQAHQPPVDAADDHENQTDFIKGLRKKTLPSLGIAFPEKGGFMHSETLTAAIWG